MPELGYRFKEIKTRTGVAISTASDIHRYTIKNATAKREAVQSESQEAIPRLRDEGEPS